MERNEQQAAIAEACGWKRDGTWEGYPRWTTPKGERFGTKDDPLKCVPDYLNDLNATVQVCDFLAERGWNCEIGNGLDKTWECEFYKAATDQTHPDNLGTRGGKQIELHYGCADTLPEAISEAFLRTLGIWRDDASVLGRVAADTAAT